MPLGIYISIPFCRTKCSYCNFASGVFSKAAFGRYVDRVCADIENALQTSADMGGKMDRQVDSIYFGGGTPTVLDPSQIERIFVALRQQFAISPQAEVTVECVPGTLTPEMLDTLLRNGVNRISLGAQSFVDQEASAVGRMHKRTNILRDIEYLRSARILNINIDLIAGLPHQTTESWEFSLRETIATGVPHVSVYMLEVDEDSRLGRELLAGGNRYHAHFVPDEDAMADFYLTACERLQSAGIAQYEISNFSREKFESRHNLKYWTRQPYLGFGVDAHSMLHLSEEDNDAVRFANCDSVERYISGHELHRTVVSHREALEENFFLGLRLSHGVNLRDLASEFGNEVLTGPCATISELVQDGLLEKSRDCIRLTAHGRLLSNEVFARFLAIEEVSR
jgi:oxygen-independent coproporphyrinogen III oxidase